MCRHLEISRAAYYKSVSYTHLNYYTNYISENPLYEYAGTYADEGISGTNTKKRDEFNRMSCLLYTSYCRNRICGMYGGEGSGV